MTATQDQQERIPAPLVAYLGRVVTTLELELGASLKGVYAIGSVALRDWMPRLSDVDVAVVARQPLEALTLRRLAERLDHAQLPVPARKLELVVYDEAKVRRGDATFAMNLNTGAEGPSTVDLDPALVPRFWFVLDLAIAHDKAITLRGPAAREAWAAPSQDEVRSALVQGLEWYADSGGDPDGTLLAASRAWHYLATGKWTGKVSAARWTALELRTEDPILAAAVNAAASARATGRGRNNGPSASESAASLSRLVISLLS
jgi:predicted nucleotidyltransferase